MNHAEASPTIATSAGGEQRVSQLEGDRACIRCGFNLSGQSVIREDKYGLLIVRCPECGTAASMQEYPLLGRWAGKLMFALVGAWLIVLCVMFTLNVVLVSVTTYETGQAMLSPLARHIEDVYRKGQESLAGPANPTNYYAYNGNGFAKEWWDQQDRAAFFREAGGWSGAVAWVDAIPLAFLSPLLFGFGAGWSVALAGARRWRAWLVPGLVLSVSLAILIMTHLTNFGADNTNWSWRGGTIAAEIFLGPRVQSLCLAICALFTALGVWLGRGLARWIVVVMLPPRMRVPMAFLWRADGKAMPRP